MELSIYKISFKMLRVIRFPGSSYVGGVGLLALTFLSPSLEILFHGSIKLDIIRLNFPTE